MDQNLSIGATSMHVDYSPLPPLRMQRGVATLLTTGVLLFLITIISFVTAQTVIVEKQITANQQREVQALASAQAGLDYAMGLLDLGKMNTVAGIKQTDWTVLGELIVTDPNNLPECQVADAPQFYILVEDVSAGFYDIRSTGFSEDCLGQRTVRQRMAKGMGGLPELPKAPLVSGGSVAGQGSAAHNMVNPEAPFTIWCAQEHNPANANTLISNPDDPCAFADPSITLRSCMPTGGNPGPLFNDQGLSVLASDQNLESLADNDLFMRNFLGVEDVQALRDTFDITEILGSEIETAAGADADGSYLVNGSVNVNGGTFGCSVALNPTTECGRAGNAGTEQPKAIIIDGDLTVSGSPVIYGLVYVTGNVNMQGGTLRVFGSMIAEGSVSGQGNVDLYFSSTTLSGVDLGVKSSTAVPGTWRDWN